MAKTIKDYRNDATLSKQYNYVGCGLGIATRREFIQHVKNNGGACYEQITRDYAKEEKEREWLSRNAFNHPFGNERHPQTIAYNKRKADLQKGYTKPEYRAEIPMPGLGRPYLTVITKIEFDYFNTL